MTHNSLRVAFYLRYLFNTGIEPVMLNLAHSFIELGLNADLVLNKVGGEYLSRVPPEVRIVDLQAPRLPVGLPRLVNYLQREQPVALLSAQHFTNEVALLAKRLSRVNTRFVVSEHNTVSQEWQAKAKLKERLTPLIVRLSYPWADGIVAVSQGVAKDLAAVTHLPLERIQVIYNPVVKPELREKAQEPVEHPWFRPGEPPVVLGVGRLTPQKDFPTLIRAFAIVRKAQPAKLVILGNGEERPVLNTLVQELGLNDDVALLGFVQNPYAYMARASVFVLSSAWEGLPTVLIEAMAVDTPVVATICESGPAEILANGKYGSLVPVGDTQAMAQAILGVLGGHYPTVDAAWLHQFTLERATQQYLNVLGLSRFG